MGRGRPTLSSTALHLHRASELADADQVWELLQGKRDIINTVDPATGATPLIRAVKSSATAVVAMLLVSGADVNLSDDQGYTALLHAVQGPAAIALVPTLLKVKTIEVEQTGNDLGTPLWWAAHGNKQEVVSMLLEAGARPTRVNREGATAIDVARDMGHMECLELLMAKQTDISARELLQPEFAKLVTFIKHGRSDLIAQSVRGNEGLLEMVNAEASTALHFAAFEGRESVVSQLLELGAGAYVNMGDSDSNTPLHMAAKQGRSGCAQLLIDAGANVNAENKLGQTPLIIAVASDMLRMSKLLLDASCDLHRRDRHDNTALHHAAHSGLTDFALLLVKSGADLFATNDKGQRALEVAQIRGWAELAKTLREEMQKARLADMMRMVEQDKMGAQQQQTVEVGGGGGGGAGEGKVRGDTSKMGKGGVVKPTSSSSGSISSSSGVSGAGTGPAMLILPTTPRRRVSQSEQDRKSISSSTGEPTTPVLKEDPTATPATPDSPSSIAEDGSSLRRNKNRVFKEKNILGIHTTTV